MEKFSEKDLKDAKNYLLELESKAAVELNVVEENFFSFSPPEDYKKPVEVVDFLEDLGFSIE
ncbi:MAG: hypothetical protein ACFFFT_00130 [Candidatus Thorarchaeota archaeon]